MIFPAVKNRANSCAVPKTVPSKTKGVKLISLTPYNYSLYLHYPVIRRPADKLDMVKAIRLFLKNEKGGEIPPPFPHLSGPKLAV